MKLHSSLTSGDRPWQRAMFRTMFESHTRAGEAFDLALMLAILLSIATVMLDSVESIRAAHGPMLKSLEWGFTLLFTVEFFLRLGCVKRPARYAGSFLGVVDFLAVVPTYVALLVHTSQPFLVVRVIRLLRVFRILKMGRYVQAGDTIWSALLASRQKIAVFLMGVFSLVVVIGTLMYLIEGPERGFTSIPVSIYWAIVTLTTVGYGDIAPQTIPGQMLASMVMIMGYAIIAVPTGIVTVELGRARQSAEARKCPACGTASHPEAASFCHSCGASLKG